MDALKKTAVRVGVLLLFATAFGVGFFLGGGLSAPEVAEATDEAAASQAEGDVVEMNSLIVSLGDPSASHARVGLALILAEGVDEDDVSGRMPLVRDAALSVLTGRYAVDFATPEGLDTLRAELTDAVADVFPDGEVVRVVITESIIT